MFCSNCKAIRLLAKEFYEKVAKTGNNDPYLKKELEIIYESGRSAEIYGCYLICKKAKERNMNYFLSNTNGMYRIIKFLLDENYDGFQTQLSYLKFKSLRLAFRVENEDFDNFVNIVKEVYNTNKVKEEGKKIEVYSSKDNFICVVSRYDSNEAYEEIKEYIDPNGNSLEKLLYIVGSDMSVSSIVFREDIYESLCLKAKEKGNLSIEKAELLYKISEYARMGKVLTDKLTDALMELYEDEESFENLYRAYYESIYICSKVDVYEELMYLIKRYNIPVNDYNIYFCGELIYKYDDNSRLLDFFSSEQIKELYDNNLLNVFVNDSYIGTSTYQSLNMNEVIKVLEDFHLNGYIKGKTIDDIEYVKLNESSKKEGLGLFRFNRQRSNEYIENVLKKTSELIGDINYLTMLAYDQKESICVIYK